MSLPPLEGVLLNLARLLAGGAVQLPVVVLRLSELVGGGGVLVVLGRRVPDADGNSNDDNTSDNANSDNSWSVVNLWKESYSGISWPGLARTSISPKSFQVIFVSTLLKVTFCSLSSLNGEKAR